MLGAVDREYVYRIVDALIADDGPALLAEVDAMAARSLAFALGARGAGVALPSHRGRAGGAGGRGRWRSTTRIASRLRGSAVAPKPCSSPTRSACRAAPICRSRRTRRPGFSMTLLRLLAFEPASGADGVRRGANGAAAGAAPPRAAAAPASAAPPLDRAGDRAPLRAARAARDAARVPPAPLRRRPRRRAARRIPPQWPAFVAGLKLAPMAAQLAAQTELKSLDGNALTLALPAAHKHLADKVYADKLKAALEQATGRKLLLAFEVGAAAEASLAAQREARARRGEARRPRRRSATSLRARRARAFRRENQAGFDQAACR